MRYPVVCILGLIYVYYVHEEHTYIHIYKVHTLKISGMRVPLRKPMISGMPDPAAAG